MIISTTLRDARNNVNETTIGTSPILRVRSGVMPATCEAADTGTVLAEMNLPADWLSDPVGGVKSLSGTWSDTSANATGFAGHFRLYNSAGTVCHMQGLLSQLWTASTAFSLTQQVHNGGNVYRVTTAGNSASSGGPTGTGASITDGTITWAYVGLFDASMDNTNIAITQTVSVPTFTLTELTS